MFTLLMDLLSSGFLFFALHLQNQNSFPPPLSGDEEKALLDAFKNKGDIKARDKLIEHNLRLIAHIIKKYYSTYSDQDDLISIGTIGLIKAVNSFDSNKNVRLATYAAKCVENEILMFFRSRKKSGQDVSISEPIETDSEGNPLTLMDIICTDDTVADDIDLKIKIEKLHKFVAEIDNEREREIIFLRYGLTGEVPLTQREVAKLLNISRSYVSRIEKKALEKLKKKFGE